MFNDNPRKAISSCWTLETRTYKALDQGCLSRKVSTTWEPPRGDTIFTVTPWFEGKMLEENRGNHGFFPVKNPGIRVLACKTLASTNSRSGLSKEFLHLPPIRLFKTIQHLGQEAPSTLLAGEICGTWSSQNTGNLRTACGVFNMVLTDVLPLPSRNISKYPTFEMSNQASLHLGLSHKSTWERRKISMDVILDSQAMI